MIWRQMPNNDRHCVCKPEECTFCIELLSESEKIYTGTGK